MRSFFRLLTLASIVCASSEFALAQTAVPIRRSAPGPEIGDGLVGVAIAAVALLAFVLYPRLKQSRQSK
jgi:hypothetical protein